MNCPPLTALVSPRRIDAGPFKGPQRIIKEERNTITSELNKCVKGLA